MWFRHLLLPSIAGLVQTVFIGNALDARIAGELDTAWLFVFTPTFAWIGFELLLICLSCSGALESLYRSSNKAAAAAAATTTAAGAPIYGEAGDVVEADEQSQRARVRARDSLINLLLVILLLVFAILVVVRLELDETTPPAERSSIGLRWVLVVIPLHLAALVVLFVTLWAAVRVRGELRQQRALANGELFSGAFGCCGGALEPDAARQRIDKRFSYETNAVYHEQPTAFMLTPWATYGVADLALAWLFWLLLFVSAVPLVFLIAHKADVSGGPLLNELFAVLYTIEALAMLASLCLIGTLYCGWRHGSRRPPGRPATLGGKYAATLFWLTILILLVAAQAVIADTVDATNALGTPPNTAWIVLLIPVYLIFIVTIIASCVRVSCCRQTSAELNKHAACKHSHWGCLI